MSRIKQFPSAGGTRLVSFNTSETEVAFLRMPTLMEMHGIIADYEQRRIQEYWDESMTKLNADGTSFTALGWSGKKFIYFKTGALQEVSGSNLLGSSLHQYLVALPLDEQRDVVERLKCKTRSALASRAVKMNTMLEPNFGHMLNSLGSVEGFIQFLVGELNTGNFPKNHPLRYLELLTMLWDMGVILFPYSFCKWHLASRWKTVLCPIYAPAKAPFITNACPFISATGDYRSMVFVTFFALNDVFSISELSSQIIDEYYPIVIGDMSVRTGKSNTNAERTVRTALNAVRIAFNATVPSRPIDLAPTERFRKNADAPRVDGRFLWLLKKRPELKAWADAMAAFVDQLSTNTTTKQIGALNDLGDYLVSLEEPPVAPHWVVRKMHINDVSRANTDTFFEYLREREIRIKNKNDTLSACRQFFDWYPDYLAAVGTPLAKPFVNPILVADAFRDGSGRQTQTSRDAIPSYILEEMKTILVEGDFEFGRKNGRAYFSLHDRETGKMDRVWSPALTVCMYLMLETPVRSHQARWVDSGQLDEMLYDAAKKTYISNPSKHALTGRHEAVLQPQHDSLRSEEWLGLWMSTNKSAIYDGKDKPGYSIPYASPKLVELLQMVTQWNARYLPEPTAPVRYFGEPGEVHISNRRRVRQSVGPEIVPLFREVGSVSSIRPISYAKLKTFYTRLLMETQKRLKEKYGVNVKLVDFDKKGRTKWLVDLHTLRVSGITAMLESGVPLEVVSQFVAGHATLVMTLHYFKQSPEKLRKILEDHHQAMLNDTDFVGSEIFQNNFEDFMPVLLSRDGAGTGPGIVAFKKHTGIVAINSDGICPGTSCHDGGPLNGGKKTPVPGGQRCGLCRYWITGPAFLLGQVASVNNMAYVIRKKGLEVAQLNEERVDAEDAGQQKKARELRDRVDLLNRELAIDVEEWSSRYQLATQSMELLQTYLATKAHAQNKGSATPLLTASSASELKLTLESTHSFALLNQITQMSDFVTGFKNREAEMEKTQILSKMMMANGVRPFLIELAEDKARAAGNLLSSILLHQVRESDLDDVLSGKMNLNDFPALASAVAKLRDVADDDSGSPVEWDAVSASLSSASTVQPKSKLHTRGSH